MQAMLVVCFNVEQIRIRDMLQALLVLYFNVEIKVRHILSKTDHTHIKTVEELSGRGEPPKLVGEQMLFQRLGNIG